MAPIASTDITGMVLAGGRGSRMGGIDKGLQPYQGHALALHALRRLQPQVGSCLINANRNLETYAQWGVPVVSDTVADFPGPLAGFACGLAHCTTPWLLTVPCDSPRFAPDLAARMADTASATGARIVLACGPEMGRDGQTAIRPQPVFALLHTSVLDDLHQFVAEGGRKIDAWTARHPQALCHFDAPTDDPHAFANANTLAQLQHLERLAPPPVCAP